MSNDDKTKEQIAAIFNATEGEAILTVDMITDAEAAQWNRIVRSIEAKADDYGKVDLPPMTADEISAAVQDHKDYVIRDWFDRLDAVGVCDKNDGWDDPSNI